MFGLLRPQSGRHLTTLYVTGAEIVHDDEGTDGPDGFRGLGVVERCAQHEADFQLEIQCARIGRNADRRAAGHEGQMVGHVVDRLTVEQRLGLERGERAAGQLPRFLRHGIG